MFSFKHSRWLLIFLIWTVVGLFFTSQGYLFHTVASIEQFNLGKWLFREFTYCYLFALATPGIWWLADKISIDRQNYGRGLLVHIPMSLVTSMAIKGLHQMLLVLLVDDPRMVGNNPLLNITSASFSFVTLLKFTYYTLDTGALIYWVILSLNHTSRYIQRYQNEEARSARLEQQLTQAQLEALKMQLQPHFLFNTLHSVSELLHEDVEAADEMIANLGTFLRMTLENSGNHEVTLQQELDFLRCYLEIEQVRFRDRLTVHYEIEPDTLQASVPNLIFQPIVENAVRYAVAPRPAGVISIRAQRENGWLKLEVEDDGPGLPLNERSETSITEGLGLTNTRSRLFQLYGHQARFQLGNGQPQGTRVSLEIPFRPGTAVPAPAELTRAVLS
ncbi:MAG TPA: histidine kinase [Acidobacteriota bacterium]|nr:histidine kinase [Acidobacteriota bacterium]HMZ78288.1 histidine kinase [Acidobacteriota bacterium]HNB74217.1 histidine kinase [Acidobacteriota bacterium]HNG93367.1 histidine kinase [Acidobacteriota bacterium]HNJ42223.1 histidine kinase [Acidobacteriota bacterium]